VEAIGVIGRGPEIDQLCRRLEAEGLLSGDWKERLAAADRRTRTPWYVRAMVGFGAWLASLLLIGFVIGINSLTSDSAFVVTGALLTSGAVMVRRALGNDFTVQAALAFSLTGQGLLVYGVVQITDNLDTALLALMAVNASLIWVFPDGLHRVLSVLAIVGSGVVLLYQESMQGALPLLGPALMLALMLLLTQEGSWRGGRHAALVQSVANGLLLSAFGCVLLSAVYVLPELAEHFSFYPLPWISTLGFGVLLVGAARHYLAPVFHPVSAAAMPTVYGLIVALAAASLWAPGVTFALLVCLLGAGREDRLLTATGLGFLVLFLAAFFYGIETSLLQKSAILTVTGAVVLLARFALLRALPPMRPLSHDREAG